MENVNTVNIELSKYNDLTNKLNEKTALAAESQAEVRQLRQQVAELKSATNKIVVVENRERDNWGEYRTKSTVKYDISNPEVSKEVLNIIGKIDNQELVDAIKEKDSKIKSLEETNAKLSEDASVIRREFKMETREIQTAHKEEIARIRKGYDETINELNEDVEKLSKDLKDLKANKTQEQLELAREEELAAIKAELEHTKYVQGQIMANIKNPFKLITFLKELALVQKAISKSQHFVNSYRRVTSNAMDKVQGYAEVMKSVGQTKSNRNKSEAKNCSCAEQYYYNQMQMARRYTSSATW